MNISIDISRFVPECETILDSLYNDISGVSIRGLNDLLNLPTNGEYKRDDTRFLLDISGVFTIKNEENK